MTQEPQDIGGVAGARLLSFMQRIERLEEEKAALAEDIKEIYAEIKSVGFDAPTTARWLPFAKWSQRSAVKQKSCSFYTKQQRDCCNELLMGLRRGRTRGARVDDC